MSNQNESKKELLDKVKFAAFNGLTLAQTASHCEVELNRFAQMFYGDPEVRQAYEHGLTEMSKEMLDNIRSIAQSPMHKQSLHAAIYLHKHAMNIHSASASVVENPPKAVGANVAAIVNPDVMKQIADNHAKRNES